MSVEVCNIALVSLGADPIMEMGEDNENARRLNVLYGPTLKDLLRLHPWNFALWRTSLAQLTETPAFGYTYYYQLPSDYERVVEINGQVDIDYVIEGDRLLCDEETVELRYIRHVTDPTKFDSNFTILFAARLAAEIAYAITNSRTVAADKWDQYLDKRRQTISSDAQEGKPQKFESHAWLRSRGRSIPA